MPGKDRKTSGLPASDPIDESRRSAIDEKGNAWRADLLQSGAMIDPSILADMTEDVAARLDLGRMYWSKASNAVLPPGDYVQYSYNSREAMSTLDLVQRMDVKANVIGGSVEGTSDEMGEAVRTERANRGVSIEATIRQMSEEWDVAVGGTALRDVYGDMGTGLFSAYAWIQQTVDPVSELLSRDRELRAACAALPEERPGWSSRLNSLKPVDAILNPALWGCYGRQWVYLMDSALEVAPEWAHSFIRRNEGAAEYEASLQDEGRLEITPERRIELEDTARTLYKAIVRHGTDEGAIMESLRHLSRPEIAALESIYAERYQRNLREDLDADLSGEDDDEAFTYLRGDPVENTLAALENAVDGDIVRPDKVRNIMRDLGELPPAMMERFQSRLEQDEDAWRIFARIRDATYFGDHGVRDYRRHDSEIVTHEMAGRFDQADAYAFEDAKQAHMFMGEKAYSAFRLDTRYTPDPKKLLAVIENAMSPQAMETAYDERHGDGALRLAVDTHMEDGEREMALALLDGDRAAYEAARIYYGGKSDITAALTDPGLRSSDPLVRAEAEERRKELHEAFEKYGVERGLAGFIDQKFDDLHGSSARWLLEHGEPHPAVEIWYAIEEGGTDEARIKRALQGRSQSEMRGIRNVFEAFTGRDLHRELLDELSGDDLFEVMQLFRGTPETPEGVYEAGRRRQEHYRGGWATGITDWGERVIRGSDTGAVMDAQFALLEDYFDENGELKPGVDPEQVMRIARWHREQSLDYKTARDMVVNALATAAEVSVAAITTVVTAGAMSPWLVAAISGAVGGLAGMSTKAELLGASYGREAVVEDIVIAVSGSLVGAAGAAVMTRADAMYKIALLQKATDEVAQELGPQFAKKVLTNIAVEMWAEGTKSAVAAAMDDDAWRAGLDDWFLGMLEASLKSAGVAVATLFAAETTRTLTEAGGVWAQEAAEFMVKTGLDATLSTPGEEELVAWTFQRVLGMGTTAAKVGLAGQSRSWAQRHQQDLESVARWLRAADARPIIEALTCEESKTASRRVGGDLSAETLLKLEEAMDKYDWSKVAQDAVVPTFEDLQKARSVVVGDRSTELLRQLEAAMDSYDWSKVNEDRVIPPFEYNPTP